ASERVRPEDVAAGADGSGVNPLRRLGVGVVPELGASPVREAGREQHGAVPAVEDERLPRAHPLDDLPAPRLHDVTAVAPSNALALTTANVESFASPSAPTPSATPGP